MKKSTKFLIGAIFYVFLMYIMLKDSAKNDVMHDAPPPPPMTKEQVAEKIIFNIFGEETNREPRPRIISMKSITQKNKTLALDFEIRINDNFSNRYIIVGYLNDARDLMKALFAEPKLNEYNEFRLYGDFPMKDIYGNVKEYPISKIFITRATAKKINWDNLTADELHKLLRMLNDGKNCTYWMHAGALKDTGLN